VGKAEHKAEKKGILSVIMGACPQTPRIYRFMNQSMNNE
jgi:hypothetical protein